MKPREQITGWIYPCEKKIFYKQTHRYFGGKKAECVTYDTICTVRRKHLDKKCPCGKNCKPKKIKIVVVEG